MAKKKNHTTSKNTSSSAKKESKSPSKSTQKSSSQKKKISTPKSSNNLKKINPVSETPSIEPINIPNTSSKNVTETTSSNDLIKKLVDSHIIEENEKKKNKIIESKNTAHHSKETEEEQTSTKKRGKRKKKIKSWEEKAKQLPTFEVSNYPKLPVKTILITQAQPSDLQNPYQLLVDKYKVQVHFRPFIKVEGLSAQEFRNQKVDVLEYNSIIFTSRLAIDHFFRLINEMRIVLPDTTRYFCLNEQIAYYMQKYMELRKRRIFWGQGPVDDLKNILKKHQGGKILLPASDTIREKVIGILDALDLQYATVDVYKTVPEDISDLKPEKFDMIVFFTPIAVEALHKYFPKFKQNKTRFAAYSILTANKLKELDYRVDIYAPTIEFPSMVNAIAHYLLHIGGK